MSLDRYSSIRSRIESAGAGSTVPHVGLDLVRVRAGLTKFKMHYFATVGSTNTHAARMRREGRLFAPALVITSRQTRGRGRGSNVWHSPSGVMTATFALPSHESLPPSLVPLLAGLCVCEAVRELGANSVGLKWPNDVWFEDLKLAGLLCERLDGIDLIGVGMNVSVDLDMLPPAIGIKSTSLHLLAGKPVDLADAVVAVGRHLHRQFVESVPEPDSVVAEYQKRHVLSGRMVKVIDSTSSITGRCDGIDRTGRLLVDDGVKVHAIVCGSVLPVGS